MEDGSERNVFRIPPYLAPYKAAILRSTKKQKESAQEVYLQLHKNSIVNTTRYGTSEAYADRMKSERPFCVTIDFGYGDDQSVTSAIVITWRGSHSDAMCKIT